VHKGQALKKNVKIWRGKEQRRGTTKIRKKNDEPTLENGSTGDQEREVGRERNPMALEETWKIAPVRQIPQFCDEVGRRDLPPAGS